MVSAGHNSRRPQTLRCRSSSLPLPPCPSCKVRAQDLNRSSRPVCGNAVVFVDVPYVVATPGEVPVLVVGRPVQSLLVEIHDEAVHGSMEGGVPSRRRGACTLRGVQAPRGSSCAASDAPVVGGGARSIALRDAGIAGARASRRYHFLFRPDGTCARKSTEQYKRTNASEHLRLQAIVGASHNGASRLKFLCRRLPLDDHDRVAAARRDQSLGCSLLAAAHASPDPGVFSLRIGVQHDESPRDIF